MESKHPVDRNRANEAISHVATARAKLADRVGAPWWYRWGVATALLMMFIGMSFLVGGPGSYSHETLGITFIVLGGCVIPVVLMGVAKNLTGVSIDRYAEGLSWWWVLLFALLALSFVLQAFVVVPLALTVGGLIAFVLTVVMESYIDRLLYRRLNNAQRTGDHD